MKLRFNLLTGQFELLDTSGVPTSSVLNGDTDFGTRATSDMVIDMGFRAQDDSVLDQGFRV